MATAVLKTFGALQEELEKAKENLKGVDEHIKRIIGRDPNDGTPRPGVKRQVVPNEEFRGRGRGFPQNRGRRDPGEIRMEVADTFPAGPRRRPGETKTVFSRLSGPTRGPKDESGDDDDIHRPAVSSHVIATPRELPSRQEIMASQGDERSKARNRRMFGALLGTLQKFRQEETRMKGREDKRAQVERKLEEAARREKEELKKERQELFSERRRKQQEVRRIEIKMQRIKEQEEWESCHRPLMNFIQTKTRPSIFYLPKVHNAKTEERLVGSQKLVAKMMEKKREHIREELERLDARGVAAQRGQRGQFEEEENENENGFTENQKDDKENRLAPNDDTDKDAADQVSNRDGKPESVVEPKEDLRELVRSRTLERQRRHEQSDDEEELEYDEHAKEDDDDDDDVIRADWPEPQRQKHRIKVEPEENVGEATSPKRAKMDASDDASDKQDEESNREVDVDADAPSDVDRGDPDPDPDVSFD